MDIGERELSILDGAGGIRELIAMARAEGDGWYLCVYLNNEQAAPLAFVNSRKQVRHWAQLNTLVKNVGTICPNVKSVSVSVPQTHAA